MLFKKSVLLVGSLLLAGPIVSAQQPQQRPAAPQSVEDRTAGLKKLDGYFPLYWDERTGGMLLEIPRFDTEFLFNTGLSAGLGSNDIGLDRGGGGGSRVVRFERVGPRVMVVQGNQSFRSSSKNPLERKSVEDSFAKSIIWGFSVAAESNGRVLVDATDFFMRDLVNAGPSMKEDDLAHLQVVLFGAQGRHKDVTDPVEVLAAFGGFEIAVMVGVMLVAGSKRHLIIADGMSACAALMVASRIAPAVTDYCVYCRSHSHQGLDQALGLFHASALLELGMESIDGTGATLAWPLVRSAAALLTEVAEGEDPGPTHPSGMSAPPNSTH